MLMKYIMIVSWTSDNKNETEKTENHIQKFFC